MSGPPRSCALTIWGLWHKEKTHCDSCNNCWSFQLCTKEFVDCVSIYVENHYLLIVAITVSNFYIHDCSLNSPMFGYIILSHDFIHVNKLKNLFTSFGGFIIVRSIIFFSNDIDEIWYNLSLNLPYALDVQLGLWKKEACQMFKVHLGFTLILW